MGTHLAGPLGVEPRLAESESAVLPVERQPNNFFIENRSVDFPPSLCRSASRSFPCCRITCLNAIRFLVNKQTQIICGRGQVFLRIVSARPAVFEKSMGSAVFTGNDGRKNRRNLQFFIEFTLSNARGLPHALKGSGLVLYNFRSGGPIRVQEGRGSGRETSRG